MTVNLTTSAQAFGQSFYTLWSIDLCDVRPKNLCFLHVVKKGAGMAQKHWILVANASKARVFERTSFTEPLVELSDWQHPESRMLASETERAPLGQSLAGRSGLAPRTDLKQHHRSEFAKTLSRYFHEAVLNHRVNSLALVVSNPFMGELLGHLDSSVEKIIGAKHVQDLTSLSVKELDKKLRTELRL
jgi:protein required for attachment to host cells